MAQYEIYEFTVSSNTAVYLMYAGDPTVVPTESDLRAEESLNEQFPQGYQFDVLYDAEDEWGEVNPKSRGFTRCELTGMYDECWVVEVRVRVEA